MKKIYFSIFLIVSIVMYSCQGDKEEKIQPVISGEVINVTECKINFDDGMGQTRWDTNNCTTWTYSPTNNLLNMKHLNAFFNCCPGEITAVIYEKNDTIFITEAESENFCSCLCQYDLDMELTGVSGKKYQVQVVQPYSWAWGLISPLNFEMDLKNNPIGQQCW